MMDGKYQKERRGYDLSIVVVMAWVSLNELDDLMSRLGSEWLRVVNDMDIIGVLLSLPFTTLSYLPILSPLSPLSPLFHPYDPSHPYSSYSYYSSHSSSPLSLNIHHHRNCTCERLDFYSI